MPTDSDRSASDTATPAVLPTPDTAALLDRLTSPGQLKTWRDDQGRTMLMAAIAADDPELVAYLAPRSDLEAFITLKGDSHGHIPLMLAARLGRTACVEVLLRHQPEEQCAWYSGDSGFPPALDLAVQQGHAGCVALLAPWSHLKQRKNLFPLVKAASLGRLDLVTLLLPWAPVNGRGRYYNALEAVVADAGHSPERNACFDLLMDEPGVEVVRPGKDGYDVSTCKVLFEAVRHDQGHMVQRLAPFFDLNALHAYHSGGRWANDSTALHQAVYWQAKDCLDVLLPLCHDALLLKASSGEYNGKTPVELAIDRAMRPHSFSDQSLARRMADQMVAHGLALGLDVPLPPMVDPEGYPLLPEIARERWPMIHVAQETRELNQALQDSGTVQVTPDHRTRARL